MVKLFLALELIHLLTSLAILIILFDAEYGITRVTKLSQRRWKRFNKQFLRASKKYFASKRKQVIVDSENI